MARRDGGPRDLLPHAPTLVQCELPDPGANLDHTKLRTSIAMIEHTRHGWRLNVFYA